MELMQFVYKHLGKHKVKKREIHIEYCPFCKGGSSGKDKYTFAINQDNLFYKCLRGNCNEKGHFNTLLIKFNEKRINDTNFLNNAIKSVKNEFKKPNDKKVDTKKDLLYKFFEKRKINKNTVDHFGCYLDEKNNVVFPYFEKNKQVMSKYRSLQPNPKMKSWKNEGGKPVLFNWKNIDKNETLFITEGEIDAMTLYQSGLENVVSIPLGANNFEFVQFHYEDLNNFESICLWFDNDDAGKKATKTLLKKIKPKHIMWIESSFKDANDILMKHDENKVIVESANYKEFVEAGIIKMSDIEDEILEEQYHVKSNLKSIDKHLIGFYLSKFIVITGDSGAGKSTFMNQLMLEFAQQKEKICLFSGELTKKNIKSWLLKQAVNPAEMSEYYSQIAERKIQIVQPEYKPLINEWIDPYIFLYDAHDMNINKSMHIDTILEKFEFTYRKYDCKYFILDNFMTTESNYSDQFQSDGYIATQINNFCIRLGVTVFAVVHPRKVDEELIKKNHINGNKAITNLASVILAFNRITETMKAKNDKLFNYDVIVGFLKDRLFGTMKNVPICFDPVVKRFHEYEIGSNAYYDWRKL